MFFLLLCLNVTAQAQDSYPALEKNIKLKQYMQAYHQALKLRDQNEGDPRFDYLYGFSALETGHFNEAVFALDRVTVAKPRIIRPRLELARAYLKLNNRIAAIKEFNDVLALFPPANVRKNIVVYLRELTRSNNPISKSKLKRLASFSIGYDDNINFGSNSSEIELPEFGLVTLNSSAVKQASGFAEAKFQFFQKNITNNFRRSFLLANLSHRKYFKKTDFDFLDLDLRAGFLITKSGKQFQFIVRDRPVFLDGKLYANTLGVDSVMRTPLGAKKALSSYISLENYDNKKSSLADRKRVVFGVKLDQVRDKNKHQINLQLGKEFANKKAGKQFSRDFAGVGYRISHEWNYKNKSFLSLDYKNYKHQATYPVFTTKREDNRFTLKASHEIDLGYKTMLILSTRHEINKSNLDLYDAKRNEVKVGIRYDWD